MRILVLINGAPSHRPFYSRVGQELARRGHSVAYALDSKYTDYIYYDVPLSDPVFYLSEYFQKHRGTVTVPKALEDRNLWLAMFPDFDRFTHSAVAWRKEPGYYRDLVAAMTSFFWELFEQHGFERVVYEGVSNAFSYVAYLVAEAVGSTYVGFAPSRLPGRLDVTTTQYAIDPRLPSVYRDLRARRQTAPPAAVAAARDYLARFSNKPPDYIVAHDKIRSNPVERYFKREPISRVMRSLEYQLLEPDDFKHAFQLPDLKQVFVRQLVWEAARSLRLRHLQKRYYQEPDLTKRYYIYPMHLHPESSTSVNSPYYVDELSMIRNVATSLPFGASLYVKDHRHVSAGRQPLAFYESVRNIPNAVLVDPNFDAKTLVRHSLGVIACTSTMGYEAIVLRKPTFVFGRTFYDFHPLCVQLRSFDDAFDAFSKAPTMSTTPEDIEDFVSAYYMCSYPGAYNILESYADPALCATVASIVEEPPRSTQSPQYSSMPMLGH